MKQITLACFIFALMASNPVWARGGYGHYNGGWGGHYAGRPYYGNSWGGYYGHGGYYNGMGLALGLGLGYGLGSYGGSYYSPYYNYPSTIVTVPATPPVYIQQQAAPVVQQNPSGYWYYCNNPQGYYPYIKQCPNGWQQVAPTPPQ
jgi:hypothetical protein